MTPEQLSAIGKLLARTPSARPRGGVEYVPVADYQDLLSAAQALYTAATAPPVVAKPKASERND